MEYINPNPNLTKYGKKSKFKPEKKIGFIHVHFHQLKKKAK